MIQYLIKIFFLIIGKDKSIIFLNKYIIQFKNSFYKLVTYNIRPLYVKTIQSSLTIATAKVAFVVQGPIVKSNSFTYETLKLYKFKYPNAIIILSTWEEYREEVNSWSRKLGIIILINSKPQISGFSNINLQIVSSRNGINKAKELGAEYVIKTRTDQRFYADSVDQYLINILNTFPINSNIPKQKNRILGLSLNTFKYRMYGLSDMFTFGHISDMLLYWDITLDERTFDTEDIKKFNQTLRTFANWRICEVYLMTEFLQKTNHKLLWTIEDSWKAFSNQFCIIDSKSIDLYWGKYNLLEDRWLNYDDKINKYEELSFKEWLNMYSNFSNIKFPEYFLDMPL